MIAVGLLIGGRKIKRSGDDGQCRKAMRSGDGKTKSALLDECRFEIEMA